MEDFSDPLLAVAFLQRGMSQQEIADAIGCDPSTLSRLINGHSLPIPLVQKALQRCATAREILWRETVSGSVSKAEGRLRALSAPHPSGNGFRGVVRKGWRIADVCRHVHATREHAQRCADGTVRKMRRKRRGR